MTVKKSQKQTFELSLKRLEAIVGALENGDVPLDKAIELYEEGIELSKFCGERLKETELKLKKLSKNIDGQLELTDLETP